MDVHYLMTWLVKTECSISRGTWLIVCFLPPCPPLLSSKLLSHYFYLAVQTGRVGPFQYWSAQVAT